MRMLNDFEVEMGGDLIQGSKNIQWEMLSNLEVKMESDLI
jgi:hypothetical protein